MLADIASAGVSYRKFADPDELERLLLDDLAVLLTERFQSAREPEHEHPAKPAGLRTHVPVSANRLVGRTNEIAEIQELLTGDARLVSITGPGGVGKSRLAIEVGNALKDRFRDGAHLVVLEATTNPDEVPAEITASLGLGEMIGSAQPADLLLRSLADREVLLILDNFEQIVDAGPFVSDLLTAAPNLRVLVSSRTILRLRGEHEYPLRPLAVPAEGDEPVSEAVDLFLARARRSPMIESLGQREAVAEICRRLDGLPLAIELAAARTSVLTPEQILARLDDRFDLLRSRFQDLPERQQTMRGAIAWSVELLGEEDQRFFGRMAVFCGGFTLQAAEQVCDPDVLLVGLQEIERFVLALAAQAVM